LGFWTMLKLLKLMDMNWMNFALWDDHKSFGVKGWNDMVWIRDVSMCSWMLLSEPVLSLHSLLPVFRWTAVYVLLIKQK
jgi:hypothetical protein